MTRIAINGLGRIGRAVLKIILDTPELELVAIFDGVAVRTPVPVGSITDIVLVTEQKTSVEAVNQIFREESQTKKYRGILGISEDPIVSSDIIGDSHASLVDLTMTNVIDGDLVKIMSWYDNEWGYAHQMIREILLDRQ